MNKLILIFFIIILSSCATSKKVECDAYGNNTSQLDNKKN